MEPIQLIQEGNKVASTFKTEKIAYSAAIVLYVVAAVSIFVTWYEIRCWAWNDHDGLPLKILLKLSNIPVFLGLIALIGIPITFVIHIVEGYKDKPILIDSTKLVAPEHWKWATFNILLFIAIFLATPLLFFFLEIDNLGLANSLKLGLAFTGAGLSFWAIKKSSTDGFLPRAICIFVFVMVILDIYPRIVALKNVG